MLDLMVGLVVGMMVAITALGSLAFIQQSAAVKEDSFRLQQRVDVAMRIIGSQLRQAGSIELETTPDASVRFSPAFNGFSGGGHAIVGARDAKTATDVLAVSHQHNAAARDCLGNQPDAALTGVRVDSRFSVVDGELRCLGASSGTGMQAIVDHVEDFQVRYGLRRVGATGFQFQYLRADEVGDRWAEVQSVSVCLQLSGERRGNQSSADPGVDCKGRALQVDGLLRRVAHNTFSLRNSLSLP